MAITTHTGGERLIETKRRAVANLKSLVADGSYTASNFRLDIGGLTFTTFKRAMQFNFAQFKAEENTDAVQAQGLLTIDTKPLADDTMTLGTTVYTFKAGATAVLEEIGIGDDLAASQAAIIAAINGTDGFNVRHPLVNAASAWATDTLVITNRIPGTAGNSTPSTSSFDEVTNKFDATTLGTETLGVAEVLVVDGLKPVNVGDRVFELRRDFNTNFAIIDAVVNP